MFLLKREGFRLVTIEIEKDIVTIVENAIEKLNVVKENAKKENKQIVSDLAKDFEGIIPMDTICAEIINRLDGHLSSRTIRKYLDEKYKVKYKMENARKQKKNSQSSLAVQGPLNNEGGTVVVNDRNSISFPNEDSKHYFQPSQISTDDSPPVRSLSQQESSSSTEQKQPSLGQVNTGLTECPGCIEKQEENNQLKEVLQNVQQFTTADKMGSSAVATEGLKEEPEEPIEFEVSKTGSELREFLISNNIRSTKDTIWFNGKIDRNSGKVVYFGLGRLDQSHLSFSR